ncbi:MAG: TerC family protein [Negativicutes bacterium]|nr:TerC family protein [Negativicutes bacterium]
MEWLTPLFTVAVINIVLSGDNAVAIGLACSKLKEKHRGKAILWGGLLAFFFQVIFTFAASALLTVPYVKIVGGIMLIIIAANLLTSASEQESEENAAATFSSAIWSITLASIVMSGDNVIAVASVAHGNRMILVFGLLVSFPIIMWGGALIAKLLDRIPALIWMGAMLIGWTAGQIMIDDPYFDWLLVRFGLNQAWFSVAVTLGVLVYGLLTKFRKGRT